MPDIARASGLDFVKAHAYGNDFVLVHEAAAAQRDWSALARAICRRHHGPGADGLIVYRLTPEGGRMHLYNADGSRAELSGNGVRCLAALIVRSRPDVREVVIETDAGPKRAALVEVDRHRYRFETAMGPPEAVRRLHLDVDDAKLEVVALRVGNPQCVVLNAPIDEDHLYRLGPAVSAHPAFPEGTNVELLRVDGPLRVTIRIWERGVGPTASSGTGACAAAVAAALYGGASRAVEVISPGGTQHVEWRADGLYLTGWAEVVLEGRWFE